MDVTELNGSGNDFQAVVAVADGTPYLRMSAVNPFIWNLEQGKSWYVVNNTISQSAGQDQTYSICVPPGNYTLQFWDVCGGGGSCSAGDGFNAGTPPNTTYGGGWEIGDPSRILPVGSSEEVHAAVFETTNNVPTSDNFYGGYANWSYGSCTGSTLCPAGTTCFNGTCYDEGYDIENCGNGGSPCTADSCCAGGCTDIGSDPNNCGGCGVVCGSGTTCSSGQCVASSSNCGIIAVEVGKDFAYDGTNYEGLFAVANGRPNLSDGEGNQTFWPAEQAKTWYPINTELFPSPSSPLVYTACVPPGDYTVQFWNDGCINNTGGCGDFSNGTPPNPVYVWQIGDATTSVSVTAGGLTGLSVVEIDDNVPQYDNFYGSFGLWSYGGCGTFCSAINGCQPLTCPSGTTCFEGACDDLGYDIRNCGDGGIVCAAASCCEGGCSDLSTDPKNCGGCGIVCASGQCSNFACE